MALFPEQCEQEKHKDKIQHMKKQFIIILFISSLALSDVITFRDGVSADVKILDTSGCSVKIKRNGADFAIDKSKLAVIIINLDTISYEGFICTEEMKKADNATSLSPSDTLGSYKRQNDVETGDHTGAIRLIKTTETGYSAPMMGANGMMVGGGTYAKHVDCFEVYGDNKRVGFLGESLKPYLNPKSDAPKYLGYYQGQKIGAIGCYAGSVICLLVAVFAGQEDNGTSYGYNAQTDSWGQQHNTKINSIWVPTMITGGVCLITGLVLQFTAREQLVKAVKAHNKSVLNDGAKSEQLKLFVHEGPS